MSLRAFPARLFCIVCDTCGLETAGSQMPVEAEEPAAAAPAADEAPAAEKPVN